MRDDSDTFHDSVEAASNLSTGTQYLIVGVYDAGVPEIRYYRDGSRTATVDVSGAAFTWKVGARGDGQHLDGIVDQTDVYSEALSDTQVSNLNSTGSISV